MKICFLPRIICLLITTDILFDVFHCVPNNRHYYLLVPWFLIAVNLILLRIVINFDLPIFPFRFYRLYDNGGVFIRMIGFGTAHKIGHTGNAHGIVNSKYFLAEFVRNLVIAITAAPPLLQPIFCFPNSFVIYRKKLFILALR